MNPNEMRYWLVTISIRWSAGSSFYDADVAIPAPGKDEGHAIAIATDALLRFGRPDEVFGARAMEIPDGKR